MPKVRVKALTLVDRGRPVVVYAISGVGGSRPPVLHISRRNGVLHHDGKEDFFVVTNCNRPLGSAFYLLGTKETMERDYRLCPRCGNRADFVAAWEEAAAAAKQRQEEYEQEQQRLAREAQIAAAQLERQLRMLARRLTLSPYFRNVAVQDGYITFTYAAESYNIVPK